MHQKEIILGAFGGSRENRSSVSAYLIKTEAPYKRLETDNSLIFFSRSIKLKYGRINKSTDLIMMGRFFQKNLFLSSLEMEYDDQPVKESDLSILYNLLKFDEFSLLRDLHAEFCSICVNDDSIDLISDRRASIPLFYTKYSGSIFFSTSPFPLLKLAGKPAIVPEKNQNEITLFNNLIESDEIFEGVYFVNKGSVARFDKKGIMTELNYIGNYDVRDNTSIDKEEAAYELARLTVRSLEIITRETAEISVKILDLESLLLSFLLPFERLKLRVLHGDDRQSETLGKLAQYYNDDIKIEKTEKINAQYIHSCDDGEVLFTRFYSCSPGNLEKHINDIRDYIIEREGIKDKGELDSAIRDRILDNADQSIFEKALSCQTMIRNPFQEPFLRDFLRSLDPSIINNGSLFDIMSGSNLIKKIIGKRTISRLRKSFYDTFPWQDGILDDISCAHNDIEYVSYSAEDIADAEFPEIII